MKKTLLTLILLVSSAFAQNTSVSGQVTDGGGQAWNNGTFAFTFVGPQNVTWTGGTLNPNAPITGSLSASGAIPATNIPDNNQISPQSTQWTVKVCAATLPVTCFSSTLTITGAVQTVNLTPGAIKIVVPTNPFPINPISAYADAEISGGWVGFSYYNLVNTSNRLCTTVSAGTCSAWTGAGGGSGTVGSCGTTNSLAKYTAATTTGCSAVTENNGVVTVTAAGVNGQLGLSGSTSGTATCTAPAVAGTAANPLTCTNSFNIPSTAGFTAATPIYGASSGIGVFIGTHSSGTVGIGNPGAFVDMVFDQANGPIVAGNTPIMWNSTNNITSNVALTPDTSTNRVAAGVVGAGTNNSAPNMNGSFAATTFIVPLTATAALTAGQVVKIDSANNSSVVVAATTDTGGGIAIGIVQNSPGAAGTAQVITSGNILTPLLGTGTCTKGQFVIVDTTTAGRVQCTGTYTAGTVIGKVTVAQAVVGSAVGVMVGLR